MSSNTIENKIIKMDFDPRGLIRGVGRGIKALRAFSDAMVFQKGLDDMLQLEVQSNKVDFANMSRNIEHVSSKFNAMGVIASTVLLNITNKVLATGKQLLNMAFTEPIMGGLREYEIQINAIQTILANTKTKGTVLSDVNEALAELNTYADKTIYNFANMTDNIGKFTTAGVELDTSVSAIKGIANLAAMSGASAQQASMGMYQLSQAIAQGSVKLMDWNSVVNAGMGGEAFKKALIDNARLMSDMDIDKLIPDMGAFRGSLEQGWLTSEILLQTLSEIAGDVTAEELEALGFADEEIRAMIDLGDTATDAATKIKTLTQLKDTMGEAIESGWATTWQLVFGDFNEAKSMFTNIADAFDGIISRSADARNDLIKGWNIFGGREVLVQAFMDTVDELVQNFYLFGSAWKEIFPPTRSIELLRVSFAIKRLLKHLHMGTRTTYRFKKVVTGIAAALDILKMLFVAVAKRVFRLSGALSPMTDKFGKGATDIAIMVTSLHDFIERTGFMDTMVDKVVDTIKGFIDRIKELGQTVLDNDGVSYLIGCIDKLIHLDFTQVFGDWIKMVGKFKRRILRLKDIFYELYHTVTDSKAFGLFSQALSQINLENARKVVDKLREGYEWLRLKFLDVKDVVVEAATWFGDLGIWTTISDKINEIDFSTTLENVKGMRTPLDLLGDAWDRVLDAGTRFHDWITGVAPSFDTFLETSSTFLHNVFDDICDVVGDFDYDTLMGMINAGLIGALFAGIHDVLKGSWLTGLINNISTSNGLSAMFGAVTDMFEDLGEAIRGFQTNVKSNAMLKIAAAIAILAGAVTVLASIDQSRLMGAMAAVSVMLAELFGSTSALANMTDAHVWKSAMMMIVLASSLLALSKAVSVLGKLDGDEIAKGMIALSVGIAMIVLAVRMVLGGKGGGGGGGVSVNINPSVMVKQSAGLIGLAAGILILAFAVEKFGKLKNEELAKGLGAVAVSMGAFVIFSKGLDSQGIISGAIAVGILGASMMIVSLAIEQIGNIKYEHLVNGLIGLSVSVLAMAAALAIVPAGAVMSAIALAVAAGALFIVAEALSAFGELSIDEIERGLIGMGGSLMILVLGLAAMEATIPGSIALGFASLALIGLAKALTILGGLTWDQLGVAMVGLAGGLAILGLAGMLMAPLVPVFLGMAAAVIILGAGITAVGFGITMFSAGIVTLATSAALIVGGLALVSDAVGAAMPVIAAGLANGIISFITVMREKGPALFDAAAWLIGGLINSMITVVPEVVGVILELITALLDEIVLHLDEIIDAGWGILLSILTGISDNMEELVSVGGQMIAGFLRGIASEMDSIAEAGADLVITFIDVLGDRIEEDIPRLNEALNKLGLAIVKGVAQGISDNMTHVKNAFTEIGEGGLTALKDILGIHSPSAEGADIGAMTSAGVINGVMSKMSEMVETMQSMGLAMIDGLTTEDEVYQQLGERMVIAIQTGFELKSFDMVTVLNNTMTVWLSAIAQHRADFMDVGYTLSVEFVRGWVDSSLKHFDSIVRTVEKLLRTIRSAKTRFNTAGKLLFWHFYQGFTYLMNELSARLITYLDSIVSTIHSYGPAVRNASHIMFDAIASGIHDAETLIRQTLTAMLERVVAVTMLTKHQMYGVGYEIDRGLAAGIRAGMKIPVGAAAAVANAVAQAARDAAGVHSPSLVFKSIGAFLMVGLAIGMEAHRSNVVDKTRQIGIAIQNGIKDSLQRASDMTLDEFKFNPLIQPVVDMTDIQRAKDQTVDLFSGITGVRTHALSLRGHVKNNDGASSNVTFVQHNHSPKALDRVTIYRNSKNLLRQDARRRRFA